MRHHVTGEKIDLIGLDQLVRLLLSLFRLQAVILIDHRDVPACHLAVQMIEREFKCVAHIGADDRHRPAECRDKPDLDVVLRLRSKDGDGE